MSTQPLAPLSDTERRDYRTAVTAFVLEAIYRYWQRGLAVDMDDIVEAVRATREDTALVEIHRAVAGLECAGVIMQTSRPVGAWTRVEDPPALPRPLRVCATPGCLRPRDHANGHLPDLLGDQLTAQLTIVHDDFVAAWAQGSPWIRIYPDAPAWQAGTDPVATLVVPHELRFVPDTLVAVVTAWLGSDTYPNPPEPDRYDYVFTPGVDNGTLVCLHADYFAKWDHDTGEVAFYNTVDEWDAGYTPVDTVHVPDGEPFTGAVLEQIAEEWAERRDTDPQEGS